VPVSLPRMPGRVGTRERVMTADPYPLMTDGQSLVDLATRAWVECASCREDKTVTMGKDEVKEFVDAHVKAHPSHTRYRVVGQAHFSVPPAGISP
jgi:hypothetical protein